MPYVSFLAINYDIPEINEVLYWFESCIVQNYAHPMVEHRIMLRNDEKFKQNLLKAKDLGEPQAQALIEKYADNSTTDK